MAIRKISTTSATAKQVWRSFRNRNSRCKYSKTLTYSRSIHIIRKLHCNASAKKNIHIYLNTERQEQQKIIQCAFYCVILNLHQWMLTYKLNILTLVLKINLMFFFICFQASLSLTPPFSSRSFPKSNGA